MYTLVHTVLYPANINRQHLTTRAYYCSRALITWHKLPLQTERQIWQQINSIFWEMLCYMIKSCKTAMKRTMWGFFSKQHNHLNQENNDQVSIQLNTFFIHTIALPPTIIITPNEEKSFESIVFMPMKLGQSISRSIG